jgi:hypothetical protein
MSASSIDYSVDRLDDDGGPVRSQRGGNHPVGRLVWAPATDGRHLDGAWWPHTRDAPAELVALAPLVSDHLGGSVRRVSANIDAWGADQPRRLRTGDGLVRLGWFHTLDPATVTLGRGNHDRVTLLVVPPDLDPATARDLLRRLSTASAWPDSATSALSGAWAGGGAEDAT